MIYVFTLIVLTTSILALIWANGITDMHENHPEYKGGDFLEWDDNKQHTEDIV